MGTYDFNAARTVFNVRSMAGDCEGIKLDRAILEQQRYIGAVPWDGEEKGECMQNKVSLL